MQMTKCTHHNTKSSENLGSFYNRNSTSQQSTRRLSSKSGQFNSKGEPKKSEKENINHQN